MTNITADKVKELRERTSAGMMECKKALVAANGDIEAAIIAMREAGITKAAKKAGRVAAEGNIIIKISDDKKYAVMIEVNCETDFVGRDSNFVSFVETVAQVALDTRILDIAQLASAPVADSGQTVEQFRLELVNKLGENLQIRRISSITAEGIVGAYVHGGRIGALVALSKEDAELAKDLAMHVAASSPVVINPKDVPADLITQEKEIFKAQSAESGKSPEIIEKMITGRINKFLNEVSLVGQPFVKDPSVTIGHLLEKAKAEVTAFVRFEVGEGIDKPVEDFAKAVMGQVSGEV